MSEKIAIITLARKGSKRFPDKVRHPLFGKQLYLWTVEYARKLNYDYYFAHDYEELSLPCWVNEIRRLPTFTGDIHRTCEEIKMFDLDADIYILLQVTSPLRHDFSECIDEFIKDKSKECGLAVYPLEERFYYINDKEANFKQSKRTDNGCKKSLMYAETGSFYIFRKCQLEKKHILDSKASKKMFFYDVYNFDIDKKKDLIDVENKMKELASENKDNT